METTKPRRRWIRIVLGIIVVLLCLLGLYLFFLFSRVGLAPTVGNPLLTTAMTINITASQITGPPGVNAFNVSANTDLTLKSTDTENHNCQIAGSGRVVPIRLSGGNVSSAFQLPAGNYVLTCDGNLSRSISVTAQ